MLTQVTCLFEHLLLPDMFSDLSARKESSTLLCRPGSEDQGPVFDRVLPAYTPCSERFRLGDRSYNRQYAHIYAARLMQMAPGLTERAKQRWGEVWFFDEVHTEPFVVCEA